MPNGSQRSSRPRSRSSLLCPPRTALAPHFAWLCQPPLASLVRMRVHAARIEPSLPCLLRAPVDSRIRPTPRYSPKPHGLWASEAARTISLRGISHRFQPFTFQATPMPNSATICVSSWSRLSSPKARPSTQGSATVPLPAQRHSLGCCAVHAELTSTTVLFKIASEDGGPRWRQCNGARLLSVSRLSSCPAQAGPVAAVTTAAQVQPPTRGQMLRNPHRTLLRLRPDCHQAPLPRPRSKPARSSLVPYAKEPSRAPSQTISATPTRLNAQKARQMTGVPASETQPTGALLSSMPQSWSDAFRAWVRPTARRGRRS